MFALGSRSWFWQFGGVLVLIAGALAVDGELGPGKQLADFLKPATTTELSLTGSAESARAESLLVERGGQTIPLREIVIVQSEVQTVDTPEFRAKVEALQHEIASLGPEVAIPERNYYTTTPPDENLVSADRMTTFMTVVMAGDYVEAVKNVEHVLDVVEEANGVDGFRALTIGDASIAFEQNELSEKDLRQGERIGIPVALVILVVLFGTLAAVLMPIGLSIVGIIVALGITALIGQTFDLVFFVTLMIVMIGLAVGIDYSILIISRFRDERARGRNKLEAIERAGATAGRTVLFSGLTVVIALVGMLIVPFSFFQSLGIGAILVVLVALSATFTFLPASLAVFGDHLNRLPVPFFGRKATQVSSGTDGSGDGFWEMMTRMVMRYPLISILVVGVPMVFVTLFYFQWPGINTGLNGVSAFPEGAETREAFFVMEEEFSFGVVNPTDMVTDIRERYVPEAFAGVAAEVLVGGITAEVADTFSIVDRYTPVVFAFVLGCSFLILMVVFRSIVIPIKVVFMNLLSVGAAYGLIVLVFQKGIGADLLGFQRAEVIDAWIPLFLFSILFGLSMDYHVFLLSRIRERYDQTGDNREAVAYGLRSTAGIITGCALIMVAVFGAFASGDTIINQQVGFGLAVAVLLDATLVRSVLVPASMEFLGHRNWYLPSFLRWLPDVRVEPEEE